MPQILLVLAFILFALCVWKFLPRSLLIIRPGTNSYFRKHSDTIISEKYNEAIQKTAGEIETLGFIRLGIKVEKLPLWEKTINELALACTKEQTFASISVVNNKVIYYFYTPFTNGRVVLTANGAFPAITVDDILQSAVASAEPEDLLTIHRKRIETFSSKGSQPYEFYDQESRIKATHQYYKTPTVRKMMRLSGLLYLFIFLIIGCLPLIYSIFNLIKHI
jgi:hypothetical protein